MDLRLFHPTGNANRSYRRFDRLNAWTRLQPCRFLEWIGWYTHSVPLRLLGHYRLYQLYKKHYDRTAADIPPVHGYILQYRSSYWVKYYWYLFISRFPSMWGIPDRQVEIYAINKTLVYHRAAILYEFLANADLDFEKAYRHALDQIYHPEFLNTAAITKTEHSNVFVQVEQHNTITDAHNELNIHPIVEKQTTTKETIVIKEAPAAKELTGKEKGVFSKKQVLILFDLLAAAPKIERIDLFRQTKLEPTAQFFQALTGKGKDTWVETLKDYRNNDLYRCYTSGERSQLITVLENLATITRNAGFRTVAGLADKKIMELERRR